MKASAARLLMTVSCTALLAASAQGQEHDLVLARAEPAKTQSAAIVPPAAAPAETKPKSLVVGVMLADVGYSDGFRLSNLGGRREVFIPVPQGVDLALARTRAGARRRQRP